MHRSYLHENPAYHGISNERLEFLGDAVVGLVIAEYVFANYPDADEGDLTTMRASLVRLQTLARAASLLDLVSLLFLGHGEEEATRQRQNRPIGQAFEAIVGAIYVDQGIATARDFLLRILQPEIERLVAAKGSRDPKSRLQEVTQATVGIAPRYRVVSAFGPGHQPHFVVEVLVGDDVLGSGEGDKKQDAEQSAARQALEVWRPPPPA